MDAIFGKPTWAIVELMGRQVVAGEISEVTIAGAAMLRVDVPAVYEDGAKALDEYTKFYGATAVYALTPTDEASARHAVEMLRARPLNVYEIPYRALPQPHLANDEDAESPF